MLWQEITSSLLDVLQLVLPHFSLSTSSHILRHICEHSDSSQLFGQQLQKAYLAEVELDLEN